MDHEMNDLFFSAVFWMGVVFCVLGLAVGVFWAIFPDLAPNLLQLMNV